MAEESSSQYRSTTSYELKVGETTFTQKSDGGEKGVQSFVIESHIDMVDMITIRMEGRNDWNLQVGDQVEAKVEKEGQTLFKGQVTAIEPAFLGEAGSSLVIRALDDIHKLGRGRKTRFWEEAMDSDIVSEVGAECGLSVDADSTQTTLPYVIQRNETNVAFIKRLAARNNFMFRVEDDKLLFKENQYSGDEFTFNYGQDLPAFKLSYNTSEMVSQVIVRGWDPATKQEIVGVASSGDITRIGGGDLGLDIAENKFGSTTAYITDVPVSSQEQATAIAKAELERIARRFARGTCKITGQDEIRAGAVVSFSGLGEPYDGSYYVIGARHIVGARTGYMTELTFCSNTLGS